MSKSISQDNFIRQKPLISNECCYREQKTSSSISIYIQLFFSFRFLIIAIIDLIITFMYLVQVPPENSLTSKSLCKNNGFIIPITFGKIRSLNEYQDVGGEEIRDTKVDFVHLIHFIALPFHFQMRFL